MPDQARGPSTASDRLAPLRNHPLFKGFGADLIAHLGAGATTRKIARDTTIFSKGDPGVGLIVVCSGVVKICIQSPDGREVVLNLVYDGEIFGEIALLDGRPRTADAVAMSDCELMTIERRNFLSILNEEPTVALKVIELLCERLRWTSQKVEEVMFLNLPGRLAKTVLRLSEKAGASAQRRLTITQHELSQLVGMSRENTNRQLRDWEKRKWVKLERGSLVVLASGALAAVAESDAEGDRH